MSDSKAKSVAETKAATAANWMKEESRRVLADGDGSIEAKMAARANAMAEDESLIAALKARGEARNKAQAEEEARIKAAGANEWFYLLDGVQMGPVTLPELREKMADESIVPPLRLVWTEGMSGWKPVYELPMLSEPVAVTLKRSDSVAADLAQAQQAAAEAKAAEEACVAAAAKAEEDLRAHDAKDARRAAVERARAEASERALAAAALVAKAKADEEARIDAEVEARVMAVEQARVAAEAAAAEEAKKRAVAEAKIAEEEKRRAAAEAKAQEEAMAAAAAKAKAKAEEEARARAEAEAKAIAIAEAKARELAIAAAEAKAAEEAKLRKAAEAKAAEEARVAAEAKARAKLEEEARVKAAAEAKRKAEAAAKATEAAIASAEAKAAEEAKLRKTAEAKAAEEAKFRAAAEAKTAREAKLRAAAEANAAKEAALRSAAEAKAKAEGKARAKTDAETAQGKKTEKRKPSKDARSVWFYTCEGDRLGPVRFEELRTMAADSSLDPRRDMVWRQTMEAWIPAGQVDGLFERRSVPVETTEKPAALAAPTPPHPKGGRTQILRIGSWPGAPRRSMILVALFFPIVWHYGFAALTPFLVKQIGEAAMANIVSLAPYVPAVVLVWFGLQRLMNLGMSRLWGVAAAVPGLNLWLGYRCFACPAGYGYHHKMDGPGIVLGALYWITTLFVLISVAAVFGFAEGFPGASKLQETVRDLIN